MIFFGGNIMPLLRTSTATGTGGAGGSLPKKPSEIISAKNAATSAGSASKIGGKSGLAGPTNTPAPNASNAGISKSFPATVTEANKDIGVDLNTMAKKKIDAVKAPIKLPASSSNTGATGSKFSSLQNMAKSKLNNSIKILDKAGADIIKSAKSQVLDMLDSLMVIPEPILLLTLKGIAAMGGRPEYMSYYSLKEMIKKDYKTIVEWMVDEFNMSPVSGKAASVLNMSPVLGATKCSLYILDEKKRIKGPEWMQKNKYIEFKKILVSCKTNFTSMLLTDAMNEYNIDSAGFGETGTKEFGIRYKHTLGDANKMFPEKKKAIYWETYPLTPEHVTLYNKMLDGDTPGKKLVHKIIWKRLRQNVVVVNPIVGIISNATDGLIKELGIDKIVNAVQNENQLMYLYIREIKARKLL
jgi:hypothetical protein